MREIDPLEIEPLLYNMILGASESIDLIAFHSFPFFHSVNRFDQEAIIALSDDRIRLRAIVPREDRIVTEQSDIIELVERMEVTQDGMKTIKHTTFMPPVNLLLVDSREAIFVDFNVEKKEKEDPVYHIKNQKNISELQHLFGSLWAGEPTLIYKDILYRHTKQDVKNIIVSSEKYWNDLISHFAQNPSELSLLSKNGCEKK